MEGGGGQPVEQRRLVEVSHPVEPRRDPAAAEHLAGDLGVLPLAGVVERRRAEARGQQQSGEPDRGDEGDADVAQGRH